VNQPAQILHEEKVNQVRKFEQRTKLLFIVAVNSSFCFLKEQTFMSHIPICEVFHHEDHWFNENDENGETTSNLAVDDLDHLTCVDFYYLDLDDPKNVSWYSNSVSYPDVETYRDLAELGKDYGPFIYFFNESNKKFANWFDAYCDMADHIAFHHIAHKGSKLEKIIGISNIRLNCNAYFADIVRRYTDHYSDGSNTYGKIIGSPIINIEQKS
jgi:hypothetical protein